MDQSLTASFLFGHPCDVRQLRFVAHSDCADNMSRLWEAALDNEE